MKQFWRRGMIVGSMLAVVSLLAVACGQDATPAATTAPAATAVAATPTAAPTATVAPKDPELYAELVFAQKDAPASTHPASSHISPPLSPMYDRPVIADASPFRAGLGRLDYLPLIFSKWGFNTDYTKLEITITDKAVFHNGDPVKISDIAWMYNDYYRRDDVSKIATSLPNAIRGEDSIATVTGANTLEFSRKDGAPIASAHLFDSVLRQWSGVIPEKDFTAKGFDGFNKAPIGSGPYRFVSKSPGLLKFERIGKHHMFDPKAETITSIMVPESSVRLSLIQAGRVDVANEVDMDDADAAKKSGYQLWSDPASKYVKLYFGGTVSPYDKGVAPWATDDEKGKKVRLALTLAINVDEMCTELVLGLCTKMKADHPTPNAAHLSERNYDLDKAKALLTEAGYPNCFPIAMPQIVIGGAPRIPAEHQAAANYFEKLGCKTSITPWDWSVALADWRDPKKAESTDGKIWAMSITTFVGASDRDWQFYMHPYRISGWEDAYVQKQALALQSIRGYYENPEFNKVEKALIDYIHEKVGYIPLYAIPEISIIGKGFVRWDNPGWGDTTIIHGLVFRR